jgi:hypothetical protein
MSSTPLAPIYAVLSATSGVMAVVFLAVWRQSVVCKSVEKPVTSMSRFAERFVGIHT